MTQFPPENRIVQKPSLAQANVFSFGEWQVDVNARVLTNGQTKHQLQAKPMQLLLFLADNAGEVVSRKVIVEQVWPDIVINDHALTNIVGKLRKVLNDDPSQPRILETIPKAGYRFIAPINRTDIPSQSTAKNEAVVEKSKRRHILALISILPILSLLFLIYLASQYQVSEKPSTKSTVLVENKPLSVAVLPLDIIGDQPDKGYYSDGMTEEIRYALGRAETLKVAARTSSDYFRNQSVKVTDIGQQLDVNRVIAGTVRYSGKNVRIHMEITDATTGFQVWAQQYDSSMNGLMFIKRQIVEDIFLALELPALDMSQYATHSYSAFDLYLLGNHYLKQRTADSINKSIEFFEQSIEADSKYANAYAGLATAFYLSGNYGYLSMGEAQHKARITIEKAIQLQPSNAKVLAISGMVFARAGDTEKAKSYLRQSLAQNPNNTEAMIWLGSQLSAEGQFKRSNEFFREAQKRDPLNALSNLLASREYFRTGQYNSGTALIENAISFSDDKQKLLGEQVAWASQYGFLADALKTSIELKNSHPESHESFLALSRTYLSLGQIDNFNYWLARATKAAPDNFNVVSLQFIQRMVDTDWSSAESFAKEKLQAHQKSTQGNSDIFTGFYRVYIAQSLWMQNDCEGVIDSLVSLLDNKNLIAYPMLKNPVNKFLAACYLKISQPELASPLLDESLKQTLAEYEQGIRNPDHLASLAGLYAMSGKEKLALKSLKTAIDNGFNNRAVFYWLPDFDSLKDNSEYLNLRNSVSSHIEKESNNIQKSTTFPAVQ